MSSGSPSGASNEPLPRRHYVHRRTLALTATQVCTPLRQRATRPPVLPICANLLAVTDIYQSNGACHDQCSSQYAYAIVQYQQCWCSNYAPADTTSVSDCSQNCPGYPAEQCGNKNSGLFGYIKLDRAASGTAGGASPSPSSTSQAPSPVRTHLTFHAP